MSADPSADDPAEVYVAPGLLSLAVGPSTGADGGCLVYVGALDGRIHVFEFTPAGGGAGGGVAGAGGAGGMRLLP